MANNPFPGPGPYGEDNRHCFFGRAEEAEQLRDAILNSRHVTVHGPSGSGKSSLLRAAVLPTLVAKHDTRIIQVDAWPADLEATEHLAAVMRAEFGISDMAAEESAHELIVKTARSAARTSPRTILICLDQIEELCSSDRPSEELIAFFACLDELLELAFQNLRFVFVIRDDYWTLFCERLREGRRLAEASFEVGRLKLADAARAILEAAAAADSPQEWSIDEVQAAMAQVRLSGQSESDNAEIEAAHAQIICRLLFDERAAGKTMDLVDVEPILRQYLERFLARHPDGRSKMANLLGALVARANGSRTLRSVSELGEVVGSAEETMPLIRDLEKAAILRVVSHQRRHYYEIAHDGFARFIYAKQQTRERTEKQERERTESRETRKKESRQKRRRRALIATTIVFVAVTSGLGFWAWTEHKLVKGATEAAKLAENTAKLAEAEARESAREASDARLIVGFRELRSRGQVAAGLKLLHDVQNPQKTPDWIALANDALRTSVLEVTLRGAREPFSMAAWSPEGKHIAAGAADGNVWIWRVASDGAPIRLPIHEKRVVSIAWTPDGKKLLTASVDGTARLFAADGTDKPLEFNPNIGPLRQAVISPDGTRIAVVATDPVARIWTIDGAGPIELRGHIGELTSVTFMPDSKSLLTTSVDKTARITAADGSGKTAVLRGHQGAVLYAAPSPNGAFVVTTSDDKTARVHPATGIGAQVLFEGHDEPVVHAAWSSDGTRIATTSRDKTVRNWPADGKSKPIVFSADGMTMASASFRKDGRYLLTRSVERTIAIWPSSGGRPMRIEAHDGPVAIADWSPDGKRALSAAGASPIGNESDATVKVWRLATLEALPRVRNPHFHSASILADGKRAVAAFDDRSAQLFQLDGEGEIARFSGHEDWVSGAFASSDGKSVLTTSFDMTARIWNTDGQGEPVVLRGAEGAVRGGAFSPDGQRVVTVADDKKIRIWKRDGTLERELSGHTDIITSVTWSPDGIFVLTTSMDRTARVWRADGSRQPVVMKGHLGGIVAAAWASDSSRVVTASEDHTAGVWNAATGTLLASLDHSSPVLAVAWSPDEKKVVTSSVQQGLRVWKADGTEDPLQLPVESPVIAMKVLDEGRRILTISEDDTIRTFIIDIETLLQQLDSANRDCLSPQERVMYMGETLETAETLHEACERLAKKLPVVTEGR